MYTTYKIENNKLIISCDAETQAELKELGDEISQETHMYDCFENIICNGLTWIRPEDIGALTDAPILSEGSLDDYGEFTDNAPVFYFGDYMLRSPLVDLRDKGEVIFNQA